MGGAEYIKIFAALLFVLGLMGGLAYILRRFGTHGKQFAHGEKRLKIIEVLPLDARRRLALIARDDKEHLVILGVNGETVIETGIEKHDG